MPRSFNRGAPAPARGPSTPASPPRRPGPPADAPDSVVVNGYSERWLGQGFPWVYDNEVTGRTRELHPGRVVSIRSREGKVLGTGIWDSGKVEVRRFRTDDGRRPLPAQTTAWRWIHGENDDLPGIRVDVLGQDLVITLDSPSLEVLLDDLVSVLVDVWETRCIWLAWRLQVSEDEGPAPVLERRLLHGPSLPQEDVRVLERGVAVGVRPWDGPDTGLYSDMRDVRAWLEPHWRGRRVLNLFAYTGMFSVCAALHGATEVHTVDLAGGSLDRAKDNFRLNDLDPDAHIFEQNDSFKALDARRRKGELFDLVVADPPAFSHSDAGTWSIGRDLPRLVAACLRVLEPGGWLLLASNLGTMSPKDFQHALQKGAQKVGRSLRVVHEGSTPIDFRAALDFPESRYLKCWVMQA
jgi:23S rRNA (cytosine1962-C5)-methyltransferase